MTKLLKEKGSKHKLMKMRNKLTAHSRASPDILKTFRNLFKAKIINAESKSPAKRIEVINLLTDGVHAGVFTAAITYMSILEIRKAIL
jgi:hypothetical protein